MSKCCSLSICCLDLLEAKIDPDEETSKGLDQAELDSLKVDDDDEVATEDLPQQLPTSDAKFFEKVKEVSQGVTVEELSTSAGYTTVQKSRYKSNYGNQHV